MQRRAASRWCRSSRRRPRRAPRADRRHARAASSTRSRSPARPASGTGSSGGLAAILARAAAHTDVPVAVGFGISTPEQAVAAADAGADGVIVGTRLVRAAAESDLVRGLARALSDPGLG
jgi:tryptophan synthase alpha subunit